LRYGTSSLPAGSANPFDELMARICGERNQDEEPISPRSKSYK
jgi:hypothetical protein